MAFSDLQTLDFNLEGGSEDLLNSFNLSSALSDQTSFDSNYHSGTDESFAVAANSFYNISTENISIVNQPRVICPRPEDDYNELGFLADLPAKVNIILKPSNVSNQGTKPDESPYQQEFKKFLNGEIPSKPVETEAVADQLPGKKKYIPPYTPKPILNCASTNPGNDCTSIVETDSPQMEPSSSISECTTKNDVIQKSEQMQGHDRLAETAVQVLPSAPTPLTDIKTASTKPQTPVHTKQDLQRKPRHSFSSRSSRGRKSFGDDDDDFLSTAAPTPKRESSKRKAKDNWSNKLKAHNKLFEDDDEEDKIMELELSDSDDDATWKPEKKKKESPLLVINTTPRVSSQAKRSTPTTSRRSLEPRRPIKQLPPLKKTELVPDEEDFKVNDFIVVKEDIGKENFPLWKFDSKTLLQKFTKRSDGGNGYEAVNLFAGFVPWNRAKYSSVAVNWVAPDRVQIIRIAGVESFAERRKESMRQTKDNLENFEIYLQALVSHTLDSAFLEEIFRDKDEYFVNSINHIDAVCDSRKSRLLSVCNWSQNFKSALDTFPFMKKPARFSLLIRCEACDVHVSELTIDLMGKKYDKATLKIQTEGNELNRLFAVCKRCCNIGMIVHRLTHLTFMLEAFSSTAVKDIRCTSPGLENAQILTQVLEKDSWVQKQFKCAQDIWADADALNL